MTCEKYKQHELGEISHSDYRDHVQECAVCREINRRDDLILQQAKQLQKPVSAPHLWERISRDLHRKKAVIYEVVPQKTTFFSNPFIKLAASFLLPALLIGMYFLLLKPAEPSGLLTENALTKLEKVEAAYMKAIVELEEVVKPGMNSLNIELALCYRDRIETIDEQIELCKKEIRDNPNNTHIRRYLLAALHDKKQTLADLARGQNF
jgi:hypothetical protein